MAGTTGPTTGGTGPTGPSFTNYRAGQNVTASRTVAVFTVTYGTALAAGTYTTQVTLHGAQNLGFGGNSTMPMIVVLSSTNTAFTFEFVDVTNGNALTPTPISVTVDYTTVATN